MELLSLLPGIFRENTRSSFLCLPEFFLKVPGERLQTSRYSLTDVSENAYHFVIPVTENGCVLWPAAFEMTAQKLQLRKIT